MGWKGGCSKGGGGGRKKILVPNFIAFCLNKRFIQANRLFKQKAIKIGSQDW
jgi:hypothetical protein